MQLIIVVIVTVVVVILLCVCLNVCFLCVWIPTPITWRPDEVIGGPISPGAYSFDAGSFPYPRTWHSFG